jgi:fatty acid desaturase
MDFKNTFSINTLGATVKAELCPRGYCAHHTDTGNLNTDMITTNILHTGNLNTGMITNNILHTGILFWVSSSNINILKIFKYFYWLIRLSF